MAKTYTAPSLVSEVELDRGGRTAWGAILAGTVVGLAMFAMLSLLGIGLGLTAIEVDADNPMGVVPTASPIWLFISQLVALGAGAMLPGASRASCTRWDRSCMVQPSGALRRLLRHG